MSTLYHLGITWGSRQGSRPRAPQSSQDRHDSELQPEDDLDNHCDDHDDHNDQDNDEQPTLPSCKAKERTLTMSNNLGMLVSLKSCEENDQ